MGQASFEIFYLKFKTKGPIINTIVKNMNYSRFRMCVCLMYRMSEESGRRKEGRKS